ncbi:MAG: hypothetical protein BGO78_02305 [Chloroflexi bacterium 44-23]|nr:MAG: hypothetical protein BGO78_02305 [Chloroflexi bacterium 44-23]
MGRKGVSKRKPSKTKSVPISKDKPGSIVTSALKAPESQPGRAVGSAKTVRAAKDGAKSSSQLKK